MDDILQDIPRVAIYGIMAVNGLLTAIVTFFLLRVLRKADHHGDLDTRMQLLQNDTNRLMLEHKGIIEIHQYFGVIKNQHIATFARIDELRADFKDFRVTIEGELGSLRKDYYSLKSKVDAQIHNKNS